MATDNRILGLLLSYHTMELFDSSTEEDNCSNYEDEDEESLAMMTYIEIERHPRQVGYLDVISLYSDADFFRHFRLTRRTFHYLLSYLQDNNFRAEICFHGGCFPTNVAEVLFICLQYLGNQGSLRLLADKFDRIESTMWNAIGQFCNFLFKRQEISLSGHLRMKFELFPDNFTTKLCSQGLYVL